MAYTFPQVAPVNFRLNTTFSIVDVPLNCLLAASDLLVIPYNIIAVLVFQQIVWAWHHTTIGQFFKRLVQPTVDSFIAEHERWVNRTLVEREKFLERMKKRDTI